MKILVIEKYAPNRIALTRALVGLGHNAMSAPDEKIPLMANRENNFDIIIANEIFFALDGFLSKLRKAHHRAKVVLMFNGLKGGQDMIMGGGTEPDAKISSLIENYEGFSIFLADLCKLPL